MNSSQSVIILSVLYHLICIVPHVLSSNNVSTLVGALQQCPLFCQLYHIPFVTGSTVYKLVLFFIKELLHYFQLANAKLLQLPYTLLLTANEIIRKVLATTIDTASVLPFQNLRVPLRLL